MYTRIDVMLFSFVLFLCIQGEVPADQHEAALFWGSHAGIGTRPIFVVSAGSSGTVLFVTYGLNGLDFTQDELGKYDAGDEQGLQNFQTEELQKPVMSDLMKTMFEKIGTNNKILDDLLTSTGGIDVVIGGTGGVREDATLKNDPKTMQLFWKTTAKSWKAALDKATTHAPEGSYKTMLSKINAPVAKTISGKKEGLLMLTGVSAVVSRLPPTRFGKIGILDMGGSSTQYGVPGGVVDVCSPTLPADSFYGSLATFGNNEICKNFEAEKGATTTCLTGGEGAYDTCKAEVKAYMTKRKDDFGTGCGEDCWNFSAADFQNKATAYGVQTWIAAAGYKWFNKINVKLGKKLIPKIDMEKNENKLEKHIEIAKGLCSNDAANQKKLLLGTNAKDTYSCTNVVHYLIMLLDVFGFKPTDGENIYFASKVEYTSLQMELTATGVTAENKAVVCEKVATKVVAFTKKTVPQKGAFVAECKLDGSKLVATMNVFDASPAKESVASAGFLASLSLPGGVSITAVTPLKNAGAEEPKFMLIWETGAFIMNTRTCKAKRKHTMLQSGLPEKQTTPETKVAAAAAFWKQNTVWSFIAFAGLLCGVYFMTRHLNKMEDYQPLLDQVEI